MVMNRTARYGFLHNTPFLIRGESASKGKPGSIQLCSLPRRSAREITLRVTRAIACELSSRIRRNSRVKRQVCLLRDTPLLRAKIFLHDSNSKIETSKKESILSSLSSSLSIQTSSQNSFSVNRSTIVVFSL